MRSGTKMVVASLVIAGCGPGIANDGGDTTASTETGDTECPELVWIGPDIFVQSVEEALALPPYTRVESGLHIIILDAPGVVDLSFLHCLTEVNGDLNIHSPDLQNLTGLERLEVITTHGEWPPATLEIWNNPKLDSMDALANLRHTDDLNIRDNDLITSLDAFESLETAEVVRIWANDSLQAIGLRELVAVEAILIGTTFCVDNDVSPPVGNDGLTKIDGLDSLTMYEYIGIAGNPNLTTIAGLLPLAGIPAPYAQISVLFNPSLPYPHILEMQEMFGFDFEICSNLDDPKACSCP